MIEVLTKLVSVRGAPRALKSDNAPEFVSRPLLRGLTDARIDCALCDPRKPWQNGTDESFNGKLRDECLSMEWLEATHLIETRRRRYNEVRPHLSLDYLTPLESKTGNFKTPDQPAEATSQNSGAPKDPGRSRGRYNAIVRWFPSETGQGIRLESG